MSSCSTACTYQEHSNFANTSQHYVIIENFRSDNEPSENFRMEQEAVCGQSVTCVERNTNSTSVGANGCRNAAI